jgi:tetratricopeptide (TPR) repeat protein
MAMMISLHAFAMEQSGRTRVGPELAAQAMDAIGDALTSMIVPPEAREAKDRALEYQQNGDAAQAESHFDEAVRLGLNDAHTLIGRGTARLSLAKYREAIEDFSAALDDAEPDPEERPLFAVAAYCRRMARERLREAKAAYEDYLLAERYDLTDSSLFVRRASVALELGKLEDARRDAARLAEVAPGTADMHAVFADLHSREGSFELALEDYDAAIAVEPSPALGFARGLVLLFLERKEEALAAYRALVEQAERDDVEGALEELDRRVTSQAGAAECRALLRTRLNAN